jgi:DNA-binding transcriptional LysR family regulator
MSDIDLNKLRRLDGGLLLVFRELLRTGRASRAADALGLSQPAISHALGRLRDLFDDPLFVRRPHGFEPTGRAIELGPQVDALIALADRALNPDSTFDPMRSERQFLIGAPEFVTALIGADLVNRLKVVAPRVTFVIDHAGEAEALKGLREGKGDFALGRFGAARPGYVIEPLFEDVYCVVARKDHPRINGSIDHETWMNAGHVFAWYASETGIESVGNDTREGVPARLASVPQWLTALLMVASTDGIATVPRRLAERHADKLGLQVLDPPFEPDRIPVSVMRRSGVSDAGADWFLEQVRLAAGVER